MKTITTISAIGSVAILAGMWQAWIGTEALLASMGINSNRMAFLQQFLSYCLGPIVLMLILVFARTYFQSSRWLPIILLTSGVSAGVAGLWTASEWSHLIGHARFNECGDTFAIRLRVCWSIGIVASAILLLLKVRIVRQEAVKINQDTEPLR